MIRSMFPLIAVCAVGTSALAQNGLCVPDPTTLREEALEPNFILVGRVANPRRGPDGERTDLVIERVLKNYPALAGQKRITINRYIVPDSEKPNLLLAYGDTVQGLFDVYRGRFVTRRFVDYFAGLMTIDANNPVALMRYCFDYLEDRDADIALDAHTVFLTSPDAAVQTVTRQLSPARLRVWLRDNRVPAQRQALYAFLLGHCGNRSDVPLIRARSEWLQSRSTAPDQFRALIGHVLLDPPGGWASVRELGEDPKQNWVVRYSTLLTARFLHDERPGVVAERATVDLAVALLDQPDMADLAIHYLVRWKEWSAADRIFALLGRKEFDLPIVRRSVTRFALCCPGERAVQVVTDFRKRDPQAVANVEELLNPEDKPEK